MTRSCLPAVLLLAAAVAARADEPKKTPPPAAPVLRVRLVDGSLVKLTLLDERIEIETSGGKKAVPVADIKKIDLGLRLSDEAVKQIDAAVADLGSPDAGKRQAASARLLAFRERAYPALKKAAKAAGDPQRAERAQALIEKLQDMIPEERLEVPDHDVIHLAKEKVTGKVVTPALKARSFTFGELSLKLADVRTLSALASEPETVADTLPDPGTLTAYRQQIGKTYTFQVTGAVGGTVWGTGLFTADSSLAAAAVHSGVLKVGEKGPVTVTIMGPGAAFVGSTQNGVTTLNYGQYPSTFRIHP
jgi:hypothetical protein